MTFPTTEEEYPGVCQYLGLADDADSHATYATEAHRCFRLENPTRIATSHQESFCLVANHANCPVYKGEGVGATTASAAARPERTTATKAPREATPRPQRTKPAGRPTPDRPLRTSPGSLGPRPRAGGISMPVATIGLFALAVAVIALAFWIQSIVGDDDTSKPAGPSATATTPVNRTATTPAVATRTGTPGTPVGTPTPGATTTGTPGSVTPGPAAGTYVVKAGDNCGTIAEANNVTVAQLQSLNPAINADCTNLNVDQVLKLK